MIDAYTIINVGYIEHSSAITLVGKFTQLNLAIYPVLMVLV